VQQVRNGGECLRTERTVLEDRLRRREGWDEAHVISREWSVRELYMNDVAGRSW
jgi:hypothetical protein